MRIGAPRIGAPRIGALRIGALRIEVTRQRHSRRRSRPGRARPRWAIPPLLMLAVVVAGCGTRAEAPGSGTAASVSLSLKTVPTIRAVTVSPAKAAFAHCIGGYPSLDTVSTASRLGFPDGTCWVGSRSSFPITITNTGIASYIDINGSDATPADDDGDWSLCNEGRHPAVACTGTGKSKGKPGNDQYYLANFSPAGAGSKAGLTGTAECDVAFAAGGKCWAPAGASQTEAFELTGPQQTSDTSTSWTVTITWTPVPG